MKLYDNVILVNEVKDLSKRGIHANYAGLIVRIEDNICTVCFYNPTNRGESAYAKVDKKHLKFFFRSEESVIKEMETFFPNENIDENGTLTECDVKEYDVVEVIVEKEEYAKEGVHKGCLGTVMEPYAVEGRWYVIFTNPETGLDIADIEVAREDFKIVYRDN